MIISSVRHHRLEYVEKGNQLVAAALLRENSTCWKTRQNWKYQGLGSDGSKRGILLDVLRINFQNTLMNKIKNLLGPPPSFMKFHTDRQTGLLLEVLADLKIMVMESDGRNEI